MSVGCNECGCVAVAAVTADIFLLYQWVRAKPHATTRARQAQGLPRNIADDGFSTSGSYNSLSTVHMLVIVGNNREKIGKPKDITTIAGGERAKTVGTLQSDESVQPAYGVS